jgi:hypothetical protein
MPICEVPTRGNLDRNLSTILLNAQHIRHGRNRCGRHRRLFFALATMALISMPGDVRWSVGATLASERGYPRLRWREARVPVPPARSRVHLNHPLPADADASSEGRLMELELLPPVADRGPKVGGPANSSRSWAEKRSAVYAAITAAG